MGACVHWAMTALADFFFSYEYVFFSLSDTQRMESWIESTRRPYIYLPHSVIQGRPNKNHVTEAREFSFLFARLNFTQFFTCLHKHTLIYFSLLLQLAMLRNFNYANIEFRLLTITWMSFLSLNYCLCSGYSNYCFKRRKSSFNCR